MDPEVIAAISTWIRNDSKDADRNSLSNQRESPQCALGHSETQWHNLDRVTQGPVTYRGGVYRRVLLSEWSSPRHLTRIGREPTWEVGTGIIRRMHIGEVGVLFSRRGPIRTVRILCIGRSNVGEAKFFHATAESIGEGHVRQLRDSDY